MYCDMIVFLTLLFLICTKNTTSWSRFASHYSLCDQGLEKWCGYLFAFGYVDHDHNKY